MNDAPDAPELLRAVERFLEKEIVPNTGGVRRFHARVAANVCAMVAREFETQDAHLRGEWQRLGALLENEALFPEDREAALSGLIGRNEALAERIRAGEVDAGPVRARVLEHLRLTAEDRLAVSKPPRRRE